MAEHRCYNCDGPKLDAYHRACPSCRAKWRKEKKPKARDFWIMFFEDPATRTIHGSAVGHNAVADYRENPYFIGYRKITVDMENLSK